MDLLIATNSVTLANADGPPIVGTPQYATNGDPAANVAPTIWPAYWFNTLLQELVPGLIEFAGLVPSSSDVTQIRTAIQTIIQKGASNYAADTSDAANTITLAYSPTFEVYTDGQVLRFKAANSNTGPTTISANGIGAIPLVSPVGALQGGEIIAAGIYEAVYSAGTDTAVLIVSNAGAFGRGAGRFVNVQTFEASGTYTPTPGATAAMVYGVGGGGGGGGQGASASQAAAAGGGGGGAFGFLRIASDLAQQAVTIGAGGSGGEPGGPGGSGGTTSFGGLVSFPGGGGGSNGAGSSGANISSGTAGGGASPTGATFGTAGYIGGVGVSLSGSCAHSGAGANSPYGAGGQSHGLNASGVTNGSAATGFGAGGGGAVMVQSSNGGTGGDGSPGALFVLEYI